VFRFRFPEGKSADLASALNFRKVSLSRFGSKMVMLRVTSVSDSETGQPIENRPFQLGFRSGAGTVGGSKPSRPQVRRSARAGAIPSPEDPRNPPTFAAIDRTEEPP
jgi:hypothetical protein